MPRRISFVIAFAAVASFAQEYRATLTGRVTDQQDAVVPGAKIVATHVETGVHSETVSAADGQYTLPFLPPGQYRLSAEAPGFKKYLREAFTVSAGERIPLDIKLEVGQAAESVTVTGEAPMLDTATATTGQVIGSRQVENMPLNGRTPLVLAQLAMGVVPSSDPKFNRPFDNAGPAGFSMGGAPAQQNELLIDGSPDTTRNSRTAYNPPVDSVEEVRVHAFEADAAYGHTGGGTVNVVLKSGTNQIHGTAYEFNQVSALAATPFFTNKAGQKKPVTRYNQFGVNAGGPIWIPKMFDGRNRVFWYFAWEGINDSFPEPLTTTVPTAAERQGDFSALLKVGPQYQIYDPSTGVVQGSRIQRQAFANNIIPKERLNSIALAAMQLWPLPNQPGGVDGRDNYLANSVRTDTFNNELGRVDFNINDRNKLFWNYRHNDRIENRGNKFNNIATGNFLSRINWGSMMDYVATITPTTVANVRFNWTRFIEGNTRPSDGFDFTTLGLPAGLKSIAPHLALPRFDFSGSYEPLGDTAGDVTPYDSFQIFGDVVKTRGSHTLKGGADLRLLRESAVSYGNSSGRYEFRSDWTRGPLDNSTSAPIGQDLAGFLLGLPTGGQFDLNTTRTNQTKYMSFFVQDDWRARANLTLNLGLRYERDFGETERYNRSIAGFNPTAAQPIAAAAMAAYAQNPLAQLPAAQFKVAGGYTFAGPDNRYIYNTSSGYFSPRVGYAWTPARLGGKTVFRGGFGMFVFPLGVPSIFQDGFSQSTSFVASQNSLLTPFSTLSAPFPTGIAVPTGSSLGAATFLGKSLNIQATNPQNPYSLRWNFGFQHQLPGQIVFEAAYIGNHAVHLAVDRVRTDFVPRQYLSTSTTRDQATIDFLTANVPNPFAGLIPGTNLNGSTVQRQQLLRPFPQFTDVDIRGDTAGSSYYHSLNVRFEKRYSKGFNLLANYIYSKLIERVTRLNDSDPYLEKRVSADDRPNRIVLSSSYELPFGRGKAISSSHTFVNRIIGGFMINGIYTWQIGAPANDWGNVIYYGGPLNWNPRNINQAFDVTQFNRNSQQQLGSNIRTFPTRFGNLRADGSNNFDASLIKNTFLSERINLQLRFEAFNALNHPEFDRPDLSPTSSTFGRITNQPNLARSIQIGARLVW